MLIPCPFCGAKYGEFGDGETGDDWFVEAERYDQLERNRLGQIRRYVRIGHFVRCVECGATGPAYRQHVGDTERLLPEHILASKQGAALIWNKRAPISDRAFELINKLINDAINAIDHPQQL